MRKVIIVIAKIEDDTDYNEKPYKKVTDKEGNEWKVKQGRGGKLKDKWDILKEGLAYELSIDKYEGKDFVADFELVKDELKKKAAEEVAEKSPGISGEERGMWWKEVGKLIVASKLEEVFGEKDAPFIKRAYKLQAIASLGIIAKKEE